MEVRKKGGIPTLWPLPALPSVELISLHREALVYLAQHQKAKTRALQQAYLFFYLEAYEEYMAHRVLRPNVIPESSVNHQ